MTRAFGAALLGALLALSAAAFDSSSLYVPGVALVLLGAAAIVWVGLAATGARVARKLDLASIEEERDFPMELRARSGLLPTPGGELTAPLLDAPVPTAWLRSARVRVNVRFPRRGRHELEPARLVVRDPLSLARREIESGEDEVLVLPRVEPVVAAAGAGRGGTAALGLLEPGGAELELDSLRPHREGAPASRIHWPTVARTGEMVERSLTADSDHLPLVVLDPRRPVSEEALDQAVRAAASLCVHIARRTGCALLLPGDRRAAVIDTTLHTWPPLHARLALVQPHDGAPAASHLEQAAAVFWVTAAQRPALPQGMRRGSSARYLVTPVPRGGVAAGFTVAGCAGQLLGRRTVRRAA